MTKFWKIVILIVLFYLAWAILSNWLVWSKA